MEILVQKEQSIEICQQKPMDQIEIFPPKTLLNFIFFGVALGVSLKWWENPPFHTPSDDHF